MRRLPLWLVAAGATACAPPPPVPAPAAIPAPFAPPEIARHPAALPVCRGEPYESSRTVTLSCCYPARHVIQQAIVEQREAFHACYEQVLDRDRDAKGSIVARFTIGDDGSVPHLCIEDSEIDDRFFVECVADAFAAATFPETSPGSGCPVTTVAYPLLFRPVGEV